jgi:hypothetical protein
MQNDKSKLLVRTAFCHDAEASAVIEIGTLINHSHG